MMFLKWLPSWGRLEVDNELEFEYTPEVGVKVSSLFDERGRGDEFKEGGADLRY